jgi:hypothetical protein
VLVVFSSQSGICGYDEPCVDDAGDPAEDGQDDVDEEGAAAAFAQEDCEGREEDCYDCFAAADLFRWVLLEGGLRRRGVYQVGRTTTMFAVLTRYYRHASCEPL